MNRSERALTLSLALAAVLAGEPVLGQQVITKKATLTLSGKLELNMVYRSNEYFTATKGDGTPGNPGTAPYIDPGLSNASRVAAGVPAGSPASGAAPRNGSEFYMDPNLRLRFDIDVGDKAKGVIELRTPFVNPDAGGKNTTSGVGFFSGFEDRTLELKQAYAQVDEIFSSGHPGEGLLLRAGIMDFRKDLRGDGNAFLIDTAGSEHPFDAIVPATGGAFAGLNTGAPPRYSTGFADTTEAAGGYAEYKLSFVDLDAWIFNLDESYNASGVSRDLLFYGGSLSIPFSEEGKWGKAFVTVFDLMNTSNSHLVTEGAGVVVTPLRSNEINLLELFGEVYFQQGAYAKGVAVVGDVDQKEAFALNVGAKGKIQVGEKMFPYLEVSYVEVSGDDNSTDGENQNFVSLENNNRTLIVEDGYYGLDFDTNYRGPRVAVGFVRHPFSVEVLYAYFELQDNSGGRVAGGARRSPKIGDEVDFTIGYEYSANLKLALRSGWLFDSRALGQTDDMQISIFQVIFDF